MEKISENKQKYIFSCLAFFAILLILFLRRPENLLYAQFWAEDGKVWFANAYNFGFLKSIFITQDGYFQTLSRLVASISLLVPLAKAPLVFNLAALIIQSIPAALIVSPRSAKLIQNTYVRWALALLYLLLPNTAEIYGNITNSQWHLALSAFIILITGEGRNKIFRVFDAAIIVLAGLSGPFSIFFAPVAFIYWFWNRKKYALINTLLIVATGIIQAIGLLFINQASRLHPVINFSPKLILATLGRQVIWGSLVGPKGYLWALNHIPWYFYLIAATTVLALLLIGYAVYKSPLELKLFILFAAMIFGASLVSPTGDFSKYSPLKLLSRSTDGARYWLVPMCAFLAALIWNLKKANLFVMRLLSAVYLIFFIFGAVINFRHQALTDYSFGKYANDFVKASPGTVLNIPINPPGWTMSLTKN